MSDGCFSCFRVDGLLHRFWKSLRRVVQCHVSSVPSPLRPGSHWMQVASPLSVLVSLPCLAWCPSCLCCIAATSSVPSLHSLALSSWYVSFLEVPFAFLFSLDSVFGSVAALHAPFLLLQVRRTCHSASRALSGSVPSADRTPLTGAPPLGAQIRVSFLGKICGHPEGQKCGHLQGDAI